MPQNPSPREQASAALGEPVEQWIDRHRKSAARLTYRQIARVLLSEHGIEVTPQAIWLWDNDPADAAPEANESGGAVA